MSSALRRQLLAALALTGWAVLLRARGFGNPIIHVDEEYYLLVGDRLLHGARLYLDVWDRKPPGLFLIFAAIRLLPGNGILAYQLVATGFAAVTGGLVSAIARRLGACDASALLAGGAYILWLSLLSGGGGQSPVFYNLFMAAAALLTLRLPALAEARATRAIVANGIAACLLAGLAIQTKYTPFVEGAWFGLVHLWALRRAGAGWPTTIAAGAIWAGIGVAPTGLAVLHYHHEGTRAFDAFRFANFASVGMRRGYPAAKIAARLAGTSAQLLALAVCAVVAWRQIERPGRGIVYGWLTAALIGYAMIGVFFDHYALPLLLPLTALAGVAFDRHRRIVGGVFALGLGLYAFHWIASPGRDGAGVYAMATRMAAVDGGDCPYVFAGDAILYHLAHACLPTAYAFPSTLAYEAERGATGIDEAREVGRIMAARPPAVVTLDPQLSPWNAGSKAIVSRSLARDYVLEMAVPRGDSRMLLYVRRDRAFRTAPRSSPASPR